MDRSIFVGRVHVLALAALALAIPWLPARAQWSAAEDLAA